MTQKDGRRTDAQNGLGVPPPPYVVGGGRKKDGRRTDAQRGLTVPPPPIVVGRSGGREEEERRREEEERKETRALYLKSNNPYLTGGEQFGKQFENENRCVGKIASAGGRNIVV